MLYSKLGQTNTCIYTYLINKLSHLFPVESNSSLAMKTALFLLALLVLAEAKGGGRGGGGRSSSFGSRGRS